MITKTDFLLFCDAPRHLWAKKHDQITAQMSTFDQHLAEEGKRVEKLAHEYLTSILLPQHPGDELLWQQTYHDGAFEARLDALVYRARSSHNDLFEIKSSTGVDKEIVYDVAFQAAILERQIQVDHYYVLHLTKEYIRSGELDLASLFLAEDISEKVAAHMPDVLSLREEATAIELLKNADTAEACFSPKDCPCPGICHPGLPDFSIYDIPRLNQAKKQQLRQQGILAAGEIPPGFDLNPKQRLVAERARNGTEHIDQEALRAEMDRLVYPLWFLDYETCISAVPLFDGHHPQQQVVFQYSLHRLEKPEGETEHFGHVAITEGDPSVPLLEHLSAVLGPTGSVIVWNKTFEMTMNKEMARLHPAYAGFLEDVNARIYDLGDIVNQGHYLHPGFKGSWSIKSVLPVMVPELSYEGMEINKGDQASMAWWKIRFGNLGNQEKQALVENLERYCELDTLAMVRIWDSIRSILSSMNTRNGRLLV